LKILVISHDATRTGATILLLNLLELFSKKNYQVDVLIKRSGEISDQFDKMFPTQQFYNPEPKPFFKRVYSRMNRALTGKIQYPYTTKKYDLIINNTITNGDILIYYKNSNIITYIHELEHFINAHINEAELKINLSNTKLFLYPSISVKNMLINKLQVDESKLGYLPYYIKDYLNEKQPARNKIRKSLNIQDDQILIGAMGATDWRKGSDFFLMLANELKNDTRFKFIWVGSDVARANKFFNQMKFDKEKLGLNNLGMIPSIPDSWQYFAAMDLFFLSSREDPYPLVVLEAAMMELTIACFEGTGGANEFVANDCGVSLPYLSLDAAKNFLTDFQENNDKYALMATNAREKYKILHSSETVLDHFEKIISKVNQL